MPTRSLPSPSHQCLGAFLPLVFVATMAVLAGSPAMGQTFSADTALLAAPEAAARSVAQARAESPARIVRRQGFWLEVEAGTAKGWVRISSVKLASGSGLAGQETGRLGSNNIVASSAARSLHGKDILDAKSDPDAVGKLEALVLPPEQIALFAREGGLLEVRSLPPLEVPAAPRPRPRELFRDNDARK